MASQVDIVNLALSRIGVATPISSIDDDTKEATLAKRQWDTERDYVLRDFPWPFAKAYAELGLLTGSSDEPANHDWLFEYAQPADSLMIRRLTREGGRTGDTPIPFETGAGDVIWTDEEDAHAEYTKRITDATKFDVMFASCLAWKLAASLVLPLARDPKLAEQALVAYLFEKAVAQSRARNERQEDPAPDAEWVSGR